MAPQPKTKQVPANPQAELHQHPALTKAIAAAAMEAAGDITEPTFYKVERDPDRGEPEPRPDLVQGDHPSCPSLTWASPHCDRRLVVATDPLWASNAAVAERVACGSWVSGSSVPGGQWIPSARSRRSRSRRSAALTASSTPASAFSASSEVPSRSACGCAQTTSTDAGCAGRSAARGHRQPCMRVPRYRPGV